MNLNNQRLQPEQSGSQEGQSPVERRIKTVGKSIVLVDATPESRLMDARMQEAIAMREVQGQQAASVALSDGVAVESAGQPVSGSVIDLNSYREQQGVGQQAVEEAKLRVEEAYHGAA